MQIVATRTAVEQQKYAVAGGIAEQALTCLRTVMAFNGQKTEIQKSFECPQCIKLTFTCRYEHALEDSRKSGLWKYFVMAIGVGITMLVQFGAYALAFWYGSVLILKDPDFPKGTVFTVISRCSLVSLQVRNRRFSSQ